MNDIRKLIGSFIQSNIITNNNIPVVQTSKQIGTPKRINRIKKKPDLHLVIETSFKTKNDPHQIDFGLKQVHIDKGSQRE